MVRSVVRVIRSAVPGPAADILTDAVTQAHADGASRNSSPARARLGRRADHGHHAHGPARAWAQPHLRRRAGPPVACRSTGSGCSSASPPVVLGGRVPACSPLAATSATALGIDKPRHESGTSPRWPLALGLIGRGHGAAVPLVPTPPPTRVVVARVRVGGVGRCCGSSSRSRLGSFFCVSTSFGDTYGPLAGMVALLLWSLLSSIAHPLRRRRRRAARGGAGRRRRAAGRGEGRGSRSPTRAVLAVVAAGSPSTR